MFYNPRFSVSLVIEGQNMNTDAPGLTMKLGPNNCVISRTL